MRATALDSQGQRRGLSPRSVKGRFHRARRMIHSLLLVVFLMTPWVPWIRVGGQPARFALLGQEFLASDAPLLLFPLLAWGFLILLVTSVFGRIWCGWACPQTVFIEVVYRRIERWIEGEGISRKTSKPRSILKWGLYVLVTLVITHSFLAVFVGGTPLLQMLQAPPSESWPSFVFILVSSAVVLFDFAWFREQFCTIACPYGKLQSVLMDRHSMVVAYDPKRGEPRRGRSAQTGDCVDCKRCVQVCPTGIDIRDGTQLECVACTACIDACDDVMERLKKPRGLIRYASEAGLAGDLVKRLRLRPLAYALGVASCLAGLAFALERHFPVEITLLKAPGAPYDVTDTGESGRWIANRFYSELRNPSSNSIQIEILAASQVWTPENPITLGPGEARKIPLVIKLREKEFVDGRAQVSIQVRVGRQTREEILHVVGPYRR